MDKITNGIDMLKKMVLARSTPKDVKMIRDSFKKTLNNVRRFKSKKVFGVFIDKRKRRYFSTRRR